MQHSFVSAFLSLQISFAHFKQSKTFCPFSKVARISPNTAYLSSIVFLGVIDFAVVKAHLDGDFTSFHVDINLIDGSVVFTPWTYNFTNLLHC